MTAPRDMNEILSEDGVRSAVCASDGQETAQTRRDNGIS